MSRLRRRRDRRNQFERDFDIKGLVLVVALLAVPVFWAINKLFGVGKAALDFSIGAAVLFGGYIVIIIAISLIAGCIYLVVKMFERKKSDGIERR